MIAMEFSIRSMRKILERNTEKRISDDAADELGAYLDQWASEVGKQAREVSEKDGRSTVRAEDIREVLRNMKQRDVDLKLDK